MFITKKCLIIFDIHRSFLKKKIHELDQAFCKASGMMKISDILIYNHVRKKLMKVKQSSPSKCSEKAN